MIFLPGKLGRFDDKNEIYFVSKRNTIWTDFKFLVLLEVQTYLGPSRM